MCENYVMNRLSDNPDFSKTDNRQSSMIDGRGIKKKNMRHTGPHETAHELNISINEKGGVK